ncbi:SufE family protein [Nitrospirillum sp. BR 11163]|uniref:SufE family protein n=1 Tax=Nitrospirillum sp. BR 11163 TaxID=3104323 RepID=UPI002AFF363B|nr:SufE family protein [Nitrospirillum sp. BR 11163]MEA1672656.1 SufE family protein [Nitrospirillum sp. BR 11163]
MTDLADPTVADIDAAAAALEAEFACLVDWSARLKHLMDLGRTLDGIPPHQRRDQDQVTGCQSQLWLVIERTPAALHIRADSDALIMRGLLALVRRLYDGRPPAAILAHSPAVLDRLAVGRNLAPSRANGVHLIVKRIREAAAAA